MRLPDELVHLGVGGQMDDEIRLRILDAVDPTRKGGVVAGEVLKQVPKSSVHVFWRLSTPKTSWPSCCSRCARFVPICPDDPVTRIFMPRPPCAGHHAVVEVAPAIRTSASSPGMASPVKLTIVLPRVRPRSRLASVRLQPSTSTSTVVPTRSAFRSDAIRCTTSTSRSSRSCLTSSGTWSGSAAASVLCRGE